MVKRPFIVGPGESHANGRNTKRRKENTKNGSEQLNGTGTDEITSARQLRVIVTDFTDVQNMQKGFTVLRSFIQSCMPRAEEERAEKDGLSMEQKMTILKEFLDAEANIRSNDEDADNFPNLLQSWSFAIQANNQYLLSAVISAIALLLRALGVLPGFGIHGKVLCTALLQPTCLKFFYRCVTASQDRVASPTSRLLTEINAWGGGSMCSLLHTSFDWSMKNLGRNLDAKKVVGLVQGEGNKMLVEDPSRPSVRTVFLRWILSFLTYGSSSVKIDILGHKGLTIPLFKYLKTDSPRVVEEVLRVLKDHVVLDNAVPRATKSSLFNEWVLGNISNLYTRCQLVKEDGKQTVAELTHEFLMMLCTRVNGGVYFQDLGWYPPGTVGEDEKKKGTKLHNRTLANFIQTLKPHADTLQQDLLLAIMGAAPELVAEYFNSGAVFTFDPKLTVTWVGYCSFLTAVVDLPVPKKFGLSTILEQPPTASTVIESICPKVLMKSQLTRCLGHENVLIRFLSTRLLVASFNKLRTVLDHLDSISSALIAPYRWHHMRTELVEEFTRRIPEVSNVITAYISAPVLEAGSLHREAAAKLLTRYYNLLPEVAFGKKFDVSVALGAFLTTNQELEAKKAMKLLEMEHLLNIAKEIPDVKWWSKPANSQLSFFTLALKLGVLASSGTSLQKQVKEVTKNVVERTHLFQNETEIGGFEVLLESLETLKDSNALPSLLSFLDECLIRCVRAPLKYTDDFFELVVKTLEHTEETKVVLLVRPISPLAMAITEQWKFLMDNDKVSGEAKMEIAKWLESFIKLSALIGENERVLGSLCEKLSQASQSIEDITASFSKLEPFIKNFNDMNSALELPNNLSTRKIHNELALARERNLDISPVRFAVLQDRSVRLLRTLDSGEESMRELEQCVECIQAIIALCLKQNSPLLAVLRQIVAQSIPKMKEVINSRYLALQLPFLEAFIGFIGKLFENNKASMEALQGFTKALMEAIASSPLDAGVVERLQSLNAKLGDISLNLFNAADLHDLINDLLRHLTPATYTSFASIVKSTMAKKVTFTPNLLERLIQPCSESAELSRVLANYIDDNPTCLEDPDITVASAVFENETAIPLACAIMRQRTTIIEPLLTSSRNTSRDGLILPAHLLAILGVLTECHSSSNSIQWSKTVAILEGKEKRLQEILEKRVRELYDNIIQEEPFSPTISIIELFSRAAPLFPSMNMERIFKHALENTKRLNVDIETIPLVERFLTRGNRVVPEEVKNWLCIITDYLIRRFVEDKISTEQTRIVANQLGNFLRSMSISLANMVPRAVLNALLEAILDKKSDLKEAVALGAIIASQASANHLDLTKHLQTILGDAKNPLATRKNDEELTEVHHQLAFIIHRLFALSPALHSNISTFEGILLLYRGCCSFVDRALLEIIVNIEGSLAQSCASRIGAWVFDENNEDTALITRSKGKLTVTFNGKSFFRSVMNFRYVGIESETSAGKFHDLDTFTSLKYTESKIMARIYDLRFALPAIAFCLISSNRLLNAQTAVNYGCIGYSIMGLCSEEKNVRKTSVDVLMAFLAKLEESAFKEKTQVMHLLCAILASLEVSPEKENSIPTIVGVFLARAVTVLSDPAHFLYDKFMSMLLQRPTLDLWDVPRLLSSPGSEEDYYKDVNWKLSVLAAGMRKTQDLALYQKRKLFERCLSLYQSPYAGEKMKEKIVDLLWNAAEVEGGGTTLITRHSVVTWAMQHVTRANSSWERNGPGNPDSTPLKRTIARLESMTSKSHVREWSRGGIVSDLQELYTCT